MKRSKPLQRRTPLRRTSMKRRPPKKTDAPAHLAYLRTLPCHVQMTSFCVTCTGPIESHHSTVGRGLSQKTSDLEAIPLCAKHHYEFHSKTGLFEGMTKEAGRAWQRTASLRYRPKTQHNQQENQS